MTGTAGGTNRTVGNCGRGLTGAWHNSGVKARAATSEMGQGKDAVSGKIGTMSMGCRQTGTGISGREVVSGSNSGRVGISWAAGRKGVGSMAKVRGRGTGEVTIAAMGEAEVCVMAGEDGDAGTGNNDGCGETVVGVAGCGDRCVIGAAGSRGGSEAAGMGGDGNKACRGNCVWALCCGYTSHMADWKPSQVFGSSSNSHVAEKVSQDDSSV
jgi:hypothetical protein